MIRLGFIGSYQGMTPDQISKAKEMVGKLAPSQVTYFGTKAGEEFCQITRSCANKTTFKLLSTNGLRDRVQALCEDSDIVVAAVETEQEKPKLPIWGMVSEVRKNAISVIILYPN